MPKLKRSRRFTSSRRSQWYTEVVNRETDEDREARLASARRRSHNTRQRQQNALHQAIRSKKNLGAIDDVQNFKETDFPKALCHHELLSLFAENHVCDFCNAYRWKDEVPGFCCGKGKVHLESLPPPPDEILHLYESANDEFLNKLRSYNNSLALASIGCDEKLLHGFNPTFKIQGKIYHRIGSLTPQDGEIPKFAQIYFHDTDHEAENRLFHNPYLDLPTINILQNCLHRVNPYVQSFKSALDFGDEHTDIQLVLRADKKPSGEHVRRYNLPTASEVAVIMPGEHAENLDIILQRKTGDIQRINARHRSYDPLHYVLLFPHGSDGYTQHIPNARGQGHVTPASYYRYRLQIRSNDTNHIMRSRRLTQQYATDAFAKVEAERLRWVKYHQTEIRAEKYKGLLDAVDANDTINAGTKVILPPTVYGSPRWYTEAFQDAMAIVRKYGKPDFFITFTCNPNWPEIKSSLFSHEKPSDRPDICVRVFNIKLQSLLHDLTKQQVFGKVTAFTAMKEDQKRGLPHCHILLIMSDDSKPRQTTDFNKVVCAEIPDPISNPLLYNIVTKQMIHGPCGSINQNSPCMSGSSGGAIGTWEKVFQNNSRKKL